MLNLTDKAIVILTVKLTLAELAQKKSILSGQIIFL